MNNLRELVGRKVVLGPGEGFKGALGVLRDVDNSVQALLELAPSVQIDGINYKFAIAQPRLERDTLTDLLHTKLLSCAVTFVPDDRFNPKNAFDLTWWRGGAAFILDVRLNAN